MKALWFAAAMVLAGGCDPVKVEQQEAATAKAQATADSMVAVFQAQARSAEAVIAMDSTTVELDSGTWDIKEPGEEEYTEVEETGLTYADWKDVSDDTVAVDRRRFKEAELANYLKDPDLDYDRSLEHEDLWWDRFLRWLQRLIMKVLGNRAGEAVFGNMHWIILGASVLLLGWFFRRHLLEGVFGMRAKQARQVTEMPENIEDLDLEKLLRDAERMADWRMALRYQWLKVLRKLVDEGRIKWQARSTDADYLSQLKEPAMRASFSELSFLFKWVWYGNAPMDAQRYLHLKPAFEAAHRPSSTASKTAPTVSEPSA